LGAFGSRSPAQGPVTSVLIGRAFANSNVRQMLGPKGETWIAESGTERIRIIRQCWSY